MIEIKKGASFRVALQFSEAEWDSLFPAQQVISQFKQEETYYDIEVEVDASTRCIFLRAETNSWKPGQGAFDVKLISDGLITIVPELTNVEVTIVEGITR